MKKNPISPKKLILGTVQLGLPYGVNNSAGKPSESEAWAILDAAKAAGIHQLDTADGYGDSQKVIGRYSAERGGFSVFTKFSFSPGEQSISGHLQQTLLELNYPFVEGYSFHRFQDFSRYSNQMELASIKPSLTRRIGLSVYSNDELKAAIGSDWIDVIQLPFNLLDNRPAKNGLLAEARARGKTLHVRSVYLQGLFFKDPASFPAKLEPLKPHIEKLKRIAGDSSLTIGELALLYPLSIPEIHGVLIGVETASQLEESLLALEKGPLPESVINRIDELRVQENELLSPVNW